MACSVVCSTKRWHFQMAQQFRWHACGRPGVGPRVQMMIMDGPVHETRPTAPKTRQEKIQKTTINSRTIQMFHYYSPNRVSTLRNSCGRPFTRKFPHRMALVRCPSAFRPHRLAQSCRGFGLRHFICKFCIKCFFCNFQVHFDYAGLHKVLSAVLVRAILLVNSRIHDEMYSAVRFRTKYGPRTWSAAFYI